MKYFECEHETEKSTTDVRREINLRQRTATGSGVGSFKRRRALAVTPLLAAVVYLLAAQVAFGAGSTTDSGLEKTCVDAVTAAPDPFELTQTRRDGGMTPVHGYQVLFRSTIKIGVQELPASCQGAFRATGLILARYKDTKHAGWWLTAGGGVSFLRPESGAGVESSILSSNKEIGCFQAVRLSFSVKVLNLSNGATAAKRTFRRPAQPLTCSGQPEKSRALAAFDGLGRFARRATAPEAEEECIEVATNAPTGHETTLRFRNDVPLGSNKREHWKAAFFLPAMPKECAGAIGRYFFYAIQIQDAKNPDQWVFQNRHKKWWAPDNDLDAHWLGQHGWSHTGQPDQWTKGVYECSPGPRKTEARVLIKARAYARESGQPTISQRTYEVPVKVTGAC